MCPTGSRCIHWRRRRCWSICLLNKPHALYDQLPPPKRPVEELAADLGRTSTPSYPGAEEGTWEHRQLDWSANGAGWFEKRCTDAEKLCKGGMKPGSYSYYYSEFAPKGVREFFGDLLSFSEARLREVVDNLESKRGGYWTSDQVKQGCGVAIEFTTFSAGGAVTAHDYGAAAEVEDLIAEATS